MAALATAITRTFKARVASSPRYFPTTNPARLTGRASSA